MSGARVMVAAFGDPGHAFPAIALARALAQRGNEVVVETWEHWREAVEVVGLGFVAAQEYQTFPPRPADESGDPSAADAALAMLPMLESESYDVVVSDILTLAPALAAERAGLRRATLIPHVYPVHEAGLPFFAIGAMPPRTPVGRAMWRAALPVLLGGLKRGRTELNESRAPGRPPADRAPARRDLRAPRAGCDVPAARVSAPLARLGPDHRAHAVRASLPGRRAAAWRRAARPRCAVDRAGPRLPPGQAALEALADEPVRVLATTNRHAPPEPLPPAPPNALIVDWLSYTQAMAAADLVLCHGGHGTVARALAAGAPLICCPAVGDMAENGVRVAWSGAGLMLPWRLISAASLRLTVRKALGDPSLRERAREIEAWAADNDGAGRGAELIEQLARS